MFIRRFAALAAALFACSVSAQIVPEFAYQGQLNFNGSPFTGSADVQFTLWNASSGGSSASATITVPNVSVSNGVFQTVVDFGAPQLLTNGNSGPLYVEIAVRTPAGSGSYTTLSPRQPLSAVARASQVNGLTPVLGAGPNVAACGQGTQFGFTNQGVIWQSIIPSKTVYGPVFNLWLNQAANASATFKLYAGQGTGGTLLTTLTIPSTGQGMSKYTVTLPTSIVLNAGSTYTFSLVNSNSALSLTTGYSVATANWVSNLPNSCEITTTVAGSSVASYKLESALTTPHPADNSPSITSTGRVLIQPSLPTGVASSSYSCVIDNAGGSNLQLAATGGIFGPSIFFSQSTPASQALLTLDAPTMFLLLPSGSSSLYLSRFGDNNGSGIPNANANSRLVLDGSDPVYASLQSATESGILFGAAGDNTNGGIIYNSGARLMQFRTNGNITRMTIASNGVITGNFNSTSSARYKTNIEPLDNSLQTLMNLRGVRFTWDQAHGGIPSAGFIAEEVAQALPPAAVKNDDGTVEGINIPALVAVTVEAVKQQQAQNVSDQSALADLKHENDQLRARLDRLEALLKPRAN